MADLVDNCHDDIRRPKCNDFATAFCQRVLNTLPTLNHVLFTTCTGAAVSRVYAHLHHHLQPQHRDAGASSGKAPATATTAMQAILTP
jgi:hypothetical protein